MNRRKRIYHIDRRTFLRGAGGVMISLPLFDFFLNNNGTAYAQGTPLPKRFFLTYVGLAQGDDTSTLGGNALKPTGTGTGYTPSAVMAQSFGAFPNMRPYVSIVSNLAIPYASGTGSAANCQPGGLSGFNAYHPGASHVQFTGKRAYGEDGENNNPTVREAGPSCDQVVRSQMNPNNQFKHINFHASPLGRAPSDETRIWIQKDMSGNPMLPTFDLQRAFTFLFSSFSTGGTTTVDQAELARNKMRRASILDLLEKEQVNFLNRELSAKEKSLLNDHFERIRQLEIEVNQVPSQPPMMTNACVKPADPGASPGETEVPGGFYYGEDKRAEVLGKLAAMAMICDVSRHGTLGLLGGQCRISSHPQTQIPTDWHDLYHWAGTLIKNFPSYGQSPIEPVVQRAMTTFFTWNLSKFFSIAEMLRSAPEGSGNVLDNTVLLNCWEGGHGGAPNGAIPSHSVNNMVVLMAGRAGGLKAGQHISAPGMHPTQAIITAMKAAGYTGDSLGDVRGVIPGLL